jgi:hypothetical protein
MRRHMKEALSRIEAAHRNQAEAIDLHGLELPYLPEALFQLSKLRLLDLSDNLLTSLPDALLDLKGLQRLNSSGNRLRTLPPFLYSLEHLEGLFLHGNDDLGLPPEVLGLNWSNLDGIDKPTRPATILEYYLRTSRRQLPLNEAKLILVGFGGVGKTSLARAGSFMTNLIHLRGKQRALILVNGRSGYERRGNAAACLGLCGRSDACYASILPHTAQLIPSGLGWSPRARRR